MLNTQTALSIDSNQLAQIFIGNKSICLIQKLVKTKKKARCTAEAIDKCTLIKAAHCFSQLDPSDMNVSCNGLESEFAEIIIHPYYLQPNPKHLNTDIALIKTKSAMPSIVPLHLTKSHPMRFNDCRVAGFGTDGAFENAGI
ncbi:MAG: trypsin-like serine protease [Xanthomonadaceae bacterium]|nr:trypsin-like serine protease [Xanthomonadaceae bacterium]